MWKLHDLFGYHLAAADGEIGTVHDALFDDQQWIVRFIVVDTGSWLVDRLVLIAPQAVGEPDVDQRTVPVSLTCAQIEASPSIDQHAPVSRQHQSLLADYYGWAPYWAPAPFPMGVPPAVGGPEAAAPAVGENTERPLSEAPDPYDADSTEPDPHLRSAREVIGYHIHATDGRFGHVEDFIVDLESWAMRQLLIDTRNWLPGGRKVLVAPDRIDRIDWDDRDVYVKATRDAIEAGDEFADA